MFMTQNDDEIEALFGKKKRVSKNPLDSVNKVMKRVIKKASKSAKLKVKKNDMVDVEIGMLGISKLRSKPTKSKVSQSKPSKSVVKKVLKPTKLKPKSYKVSGTFSLDSEGKVLKQTKSIRGIVVNKSEVIVTFNLKRK